MAPAVKKLRVGILGCGAIGSRIAKSVTQELKDYCQLAGFYDIAPDGKSFVFSRTNEVQKLPYLSLVTHWESGLEKKSASYCPQLRKTMS